MLNVHMQIYSPVKKIPRIMVIMWCMMVNGVAGIMLAHRSNCPERLVTYRDGTK